MRTIEVTFWTEGGIQTVGELVNPNTVLGKDERFIEVGIDRSDEVVDVVSISKSDGQLRAYKVPMSRVRYLALVPA